MSNHYLEQLNPQQLQAATHFEGPQLILAGAGSGKTRVLTNRIAWLIDEKHVNPWNILAITFTNKAAGEMRERVDRMVGNGSDSIWVATFHSTCGRILRRFAEGIGYGTNFTIYDSDDQKTVMKDVCKRLNIETRVYKERMFLSAISSAKDELIGPDEYMKMAHGDPDSVRTAQVYAEYQRTLKKSNAMDFDDMIALTVRLFRECPDVLDYYRQRFTFIMVDEYQDTNTAQFELIHLLAGERGNLCVVGDDDQSIYRFRGANIGNILNFEKVFPGAAVVRLEQNYRSTPAILKTANAVIRNNTGRKKKTLWTANPEGPKTTWLSLDSAYEEAEFVAGDIAAAAARGEASYGDCAILYRTNAQSRLLEEKLLLAGIPYRIVGGINFYARKEIKDLLCWLKAIDNPQEDVAVHRIINIPKRGIGAASIQKAETYAAVNGLSFYEALTKGSEIPGMGKAATRIEGFVTFFRMLRAKADILDVRALLQEIIDKTGYVEELKAEGTAEAKDRIGNIDELVSKVAAYQEGTPDATLRGFLQEVSLVADIDSVEDDLGQVLLMTLHSAKGLEFPRVYLTGMEEGLFPSYQSIMDEDSDEAIEEERRLCYVGITRAMKTLILTSALSRMVNGSHRYNAPSRFLEEIPEELLDMRTKSGGSYRSRGGAGSRGRASSWDGGASWGDRDSRGSGASWGSKDTRDSGASWGSRDTRDGGSSWGSRDTRDGGSSWGSSETHGSDLPCGSANTRDSSPSRGSSSPWGSAGSASSAGGNAFRSGGSFGSAASASSKTSPARKALRANPYATKGKDIQKPDHLDYNEGDRVRHVRFGEGTVTSIADGGRDYEVTVEFDKAGQRKMFAAFAKLQKV